MFLWPQLATKLNNMRLNQSFSLTNSLTDLLYFLTNTVYFFFTGFAFQCRMCSGSMDECNNKDSRNVACASGQDRCVSVMTSKDGKDSLMYGCASKYDCHEASKSFCKTTEKNNARSKCMYECCNTTLCNTPPPPAKGIITLSVTRSKC